MNPRLIVAVNSFDYLEVSVLLNPFTEEMIANKTNTNAFFIISIIEVHKLKIVLFM